MLDVFVGSFPDKRSAGDDEYLRIPVFAQAGDRPVSQDLRKYEYGYKKYPVGIYSPFEKYVLRNEGYEESGVHGHYHLIAFSVVFDGAQVLLDAFISPGNEEFGNTLKDDKGYNDPK